MLNLDRNIMPCLIVHFTVMEVSYENIHGLLLSFLHASQSTIYSPMYFFQKKICHSVMISNVITKKTVPESITVTCIVYPISYCRFLFKKRFNYEPLYF